MRRTQSLKGSADQILFHKTRILVESGNDTETEKKNLANLGQYEHSFGFPIF